jgi:hypothetical protein
MANTYEVPVWFRIEAKNTDEAWWKVRQIMAEMETYDQLPDHVVEEPVELLTGAVGWNMPPMPEDPHYMPPEEC